MQAIGTILIDVIVVLFFVGMAGSAVVILISFVEDFRELFGDDDAVPEPVAPPMKTAAGASDYSYKMSKSPSHF